MLTKYDVSDYGEPMFQDTINDIDFRLIIGEVSQLDFEKQGLNEVPFGTIYLETKNNEKIDKLCSSIVRILKEYENE